VEADCLFCALVSGRGLSSRLWCELATSSSLTQGLKEDEKNGEEGLGL
jgi:hypothetical protein